jgi:catechol 2,3-dioxygenase-like lactoylglutathione lyase family enzyme
VAGPLFTDVLHVAVVVADLEAAMRRYNDDYGIGPWSIYEFGPETVENMTRDDQPAAFAMRVALAPLGNSFVELIEPLDDRSDYADFLKARGEGIHHVALKPADFEDGVAQLRGKGHPMIQGGVYKGGRFAYFGTERELGFVTELLDLPSEPQPPDSVYPPP